MRAVGFGARMTQPGYNIFVTGPQGSGKHASIKRALERMAASMPPPPDWAYVHNFAAPASAARAALSGRARAASSSRRWRTSSTALKGAMPALFASEDYRQRREAIEDEFRTTVDGTLGKLRARAEAQGLALVEQDDGFDFLPQRDGLVLSEEDYRRLPKRDREALTEKSRGLQDDLERTMEELGRLRDPRRRKGPCARSRTGRGRAAQADGPAVAALRRLAGRASPCRSRVPGCDGASGALAGRRPWRDRFGRPQPRERGAVPPL